MAWRRDKTDRSLNELIIIFFLTVCPLFGDSLDVAQTNHSLLIRGDQNNPPYEFLENDEPQGFNVDLMNAVAEIMNLDAHIELGRWTEVRAELEAGQIDALCSMYFSPQRDRTVDFSAPYIIITADIFIRKNSTIRSIKDLRDKEVIVQQGHLMHDFLINEKITDHIVAVDDTPTALKLLASGKHDCALLTKMQGLYFTEKLELSNIMAAGAKLNPIKCCFAVTEGNDILRNKLNEGLSIIKTNGRYKQIHDKWFGIYEEILFWQNVRYLIFALALVGLILIVIIIWNWSLRNQVKNQTQELRQIIDLVPHMIFAKDWQGRFLLVNKAMADSYGMTAEQLTGRKQMAVHPSHDEVVRFLIDDHDVMKNGQAKFISEESYLDAHGKRRFLQAAKIPFITSRAKKQAILGIAIDITELKEKEQAHHHSEEKFSTSFMASPDLIVISTFNDGTILDVNENYLLRMGYKRDEVIGRSAKELKVWVNLKDRYRFVRLMREKRKVINLEAPFRTKNGEIIIGEISAHPIEIEGNPCIISITRDITQQKAIEKQIVRLNRDLEKRVAKRTAQLTKINEELQREINERKRTELERDYLAAILEHTKDLALIKDIDLNIIAANRAYLRAAGKNSLNEVIGKTEADIFNDGENAHQKSLAERDDLKAQKLRVNEAIVREDKLIFPNGDARFLLTRKFPVFNRRGKVIATASTSSDITDIKQAEIELKHLNADLERRVDERTKSLLEEVSIRIQAEEAVRKLNEELEQRVASRTAELQAANKSLEEALKKLQEDEEAGREIQRQLLPEPEKTFFEYEFSSHLIPSMYLSGDFTDYFSIDDNYSAFYMADVSGHGTSSAFITVLLKSFVNQFQKKYIYENDRTILDTSQMLTLLNNELLEKNLDKYLTMFYGIIDRQNSRLTYSNGGQFPFPIFLDGGQTIYLKEGNLPIGLFESSQYESFEVKLPTEFCLLIISDGILEILQLDSIKAKEKYLLTLLKGKETCIEDVIENLHLQNRTSLPDDITITMVKRKR